MIGSWLKAKIAKRVSTEIQETFSVRPLIQQLKEHYSSMLELFLLECQEYVQHQLLRAALLLAGVVFLFFAYIAFWVSVVVLISLWLSLLASVSICFAFHLLVGIVFIISSLRMKGRPFAPCTREEWLHDVTCARLSLKGKNN